MTARVKIVKTKTAHGVVIENRWFCNKDGCKPERGSRIPQSVPSNRRCHKCYRKVTP
jgi:hypothetical protein